MNYINQDDIDKYQIELRNNALIFATMVGIVLMTILCLQYAYGPKPKPIEPVRAIVESTDAPPVPKE